MKVATMTLTSKISATAIAALVAGLFTLSPADAQTKYLSGSASKGTAKTSATKQYFNAHPKVKSATIGAGVGAGVGAVGGLVTGKGVLRGAALGAGTGTGVGLLQSSETMKRHPVMKDVAQGTLVGAGLGLATHRGHGTAKKTTQTAVAGAAVGLGVGLLKNLR
ncbi:hypothetical protein KF913_24015 [Candidatus Obscuribacterales bacterium]|nr:hypothetical protein [Candidatus Obscuribacterales bacterium]